MLLNRCLPIALAAVLGTPSVGADTFTGKVVGVTDGDTISAMRGGRAVKVRLEGIDCPERHQDFGQRAKQFASALVFGKTVRVDVRDTDRYGRLVGRVFVGSTDVNLEIVRAGFAWHYKQYSSEAALARAEGEARTARRGLWSHSNPTPPWEFRRAGRGSGGAVRSSTSRRGTPAQTAGGAYHGNLKSHVFHRPSCRHYNCKNCTRDFKTRVEAIKAGFRPGGCCNP